MLIFVSRPVSRMRSHVSRRPSPMPCQYTIYATALVRRTHITDAAVQEQLRRPRLSHDADDRIYITGRRLPFVQRGH